MTRSIFAKFLLAFGLSLGISTAWAHAQLQKAVPAVGATISASPSEISLDYSEGIEPKFSQVTLTNAAGESIVVGKPAVDVADNKILKVAVPTTLKPGTYTVTWHVVSVDTHKTQGNFTFTLAP